MDKAIIGNQCRIGYFRIGVLHDNWDRIVKRFESKEGSLEVTWRRLVLNSRDSVTGRYEKAYVNSTIDMVIIPRALSQLATSLGTYVRLDALGVTADPVLFGDEIMKGLGNYYEVKGVRPQYHPDGSFLYRECDLTLLQFHRLTYSDVTPTVQDARQRTKVFWDTYITLSNLNDHRFIVCYADADYPFYKVFDTKRVDIVFAVDQGTTDSHIGVRYREHVPTHIITLDTELQWLGEAELRKVVEDHPEGSMRTLERVVKRDRWLGSTRLFDTEFMFNYTRTSARGMA